LKKSFSILEIIFTITIISIIITIAIPKLFNNVSNANIIKLRADVGLIRNGIKTYINNQLLSNTSKSLGILDKNDNLLFELILTTPIISNKNSGGNWSKSSSNRYHAWIDSTLSVEFIYDNELNSFDCDFANEYCKELTQ
jgi:type II secretory pathway pseudopilin PulG